MNTPLPNCSTAGASRDSAQAARRARTGVHSCGTTPTPAKRLARSNSDGRTDGRRRFPPLKSLIILCGAKAKAALRLAAWAVAVLRVQDCSTVFQGAPVG